MPYSSKILLFGEHTINRGSDALAIPYPRFSGQWAHSDDVSLQQNLSAFVDYLENLQQQNDLLAAIDLQTFRQELSSGLYFQSNIPVGYGLGSSGALCAAVYDRFCTHKIERAEQTRYPALRRALAQLESFFHGASSATDVLVAYLQQPLLLRSDGRVETVVLPPASELTFFLLDTGITRQAGTLVHFFLQQCEKERFLKKVQTELVRFANDAIAAFLQADWDALFENASQISRFELEELPAMTPEPFHEIWKAGLNGDLYRLKICGAGGGGFLLGITKNWAQTQAYLKNYRLSKVL
jgi:mevalonate kinase